jgi:hypothetical protein
LDRASTGTLVSIDFEGDGRPGADGRADLGADEAPATYVPMADTVAPVSYALSLARLQTQPILEIAYRASDAESGLAGVELFYSKDGGAFVSAGIYQASPIAFDTTTTGGMENMPSIQLLSIRAATQNRRLRHPTSKRW